MSLFYKCYVCDKRKLDIGEVPELEIRGSTEGMGYILKRKVCKKCWAFFQNHPDGEYEYRGK